MLPHSDLPSLAPLLPETLPPDSLISEAQPATVSVDDATAVTAVETTVETTVATTAETTAETTAPAPQEAQASAESAAAVAPATSPAACSAQLKQLFPALFTGVAKPLKLRIQADIQTRAPGLFTKQLLSVVLRRYTGSHSYLVALTQATQRFDLDGAPAGELSAEHKQAAMDELTLRRATQREAQREAQRGVQQEGQRKLQHDQRQERQAQQAQQERLALEEQKRRNRATLLHDFENTTLTAANFSVLKGITVEAMEGYLATARQEALERRSAAQGDVPREAPRDATRQRPFEPRGDRPRNEGSPSQPPRAARR